VCTRACSVTRGLDVMLCSLSSLSRVYACMQCDPGPRCCAVLTLFYPVCTRACSVTRGLDVMYELLTQEQLVAWEAARMKPKALKRRDDVDHFRGISECMCAYLCGCVRVCVPPSLQPCLFIGRLSSKQAKRRILDKLPCSSPQ
jgi:hypothetical protein